MTNDEILAKIREGLGMQMDEAMEQPANAILFHDLHMVTQSWLLLQILEKLDNLENGLEIQQTGRDETLGAPVYQAKPLTWREREDAIRNWKPPIQKE